MLGSDTRGDVSVGENGENIVAKSFSCSIVLSTAHKTTADAADAVEWVFEGYLSHTGSTLLSIFMLHCFHQFVWVTTSQKVLSLLTVSPTLPLKLHSGLMIQCYFYPLNNYGSSFFSRLESFQH